VECTYSGCAVFPDHHHCGPDRFGQALGGDGQLDVRCSRILVIATRAAPEMRPVMAARVIFSRQVFSVG
jgi:hypothetical protein